MAFRDQFDDDEWRTLQFAPFLVLSGVSGRYRGFAPQEMLVFERWLSEAGKAPGALNQELLSAVLADIDALAESYSVYDGTITSGLNSVANLLTGDRAAQGQLLRDSLIRVLGQGIARARGPYGREITTESAQMLTMLDEFLRPGVVFGAYPGDAA